MSERRQGFGLIEVIIAMVILAVGVLAMGASTGYILSQVRASEFRTDRILAVRAAAEQLRAIPWDALPARCESALFEASPYTRYGVSCDVALVSPNLARVRLISQGPGVSGGRVRQGAVDTLIIGFARPVR